MADDHDPEALAIAHDLDLQGLLTTFMEEGPVGVQIWHCPTDDPAESVPIWTNVAAYGTGAPQITRERRTMGELMPGALQPLPGMSSGLADHVWRAAVLGEAVHLPRIGGEPAGPSRVLELQIVPLGSRCCAIAARDVSAEVSAVRQLRQSAHELVETLDDSRRRAETIAHDLKNPLTSIIGYADLLIELARRGDARFESVADRLVETSRRTLRLVDDLPHRSGALQRVNLQDVLQDALEIVRPALDQAGGALEAGQLPTVAGSLAGYRHVFQNLLTNAIRHRHPARPLEIRVSAKKGSGMWQVRVSDNGVGIPPDRREQVFRPGIRLDPVPGDPGSGLGLSLSQAIVERFGGVIRVADAPADGGTTMILDLPMVVD